MRIVAVVPALNEAAAIGAVVLAVPSVVDHIVVVDNASSDATAEAATTAGARVVFESERGYGAACMAGVMAEPDADVYVFLDGDGSDPAERIADLLSELESTRVDLVLGVRRGDVEPGSMLWHQRAGNLFMSWLIRRLFGWPVHDLPSLKVIRGELLRSLDLSERRQGWTAEFLAACAARSVSMTEVAVGYRCRTGQSKVSGSVKGSTVAAMQLNAAIIRIWWQLRFRPR